MLEDLARVCDRQDTILHRRLDLLRLTTGSQSISGEMCTEAKSTYLDNLRDRECARETAEATLAREISIPVAFCLRLGLVRNGEKVIENVDRDVVLDHTGEFERRAYDVILLVLADVDSRISGEYAEQRAEAATR